jgi:hypothetical protein
LQTPASSSSAAATASRPTVKPTNPPPTQFSLALDFPALSAAPASSRPTTSGWGSKSSSSILAAVAAPPPPRTPPPAPKPAQPPSRAQGNKPSVMNFSDFLVIPSKVIAAGLSPSPSSSFCYDDCIPFVFIPYACFFCTVTHFSQAAKKDGKASQEPSGVLFLSPKMITSFVY